MRIQIDTNGKPVSDRDVRALYLLVHALEQMSSPAMKTHNLAYVADRLGFKLVRKEK